MWLGWTDGAKNKTAGPLCAAVLSSAKADGATRSAEGGCSAGALLAFRQEAGVSTSRRGVHRDDLLSGETSQVVRTARFRAGAGETRAAERLRADHRADHVAVHIDIAVGEPRDDLLGGVIDARVDAERQAVAIGRDVVEQLVQFAGAPAHHMQHRAEHFLGKIARTIERDDGGWHERASRRRAF